MLGPAHARCADPFAIAPPAGAVAFTQARHMSGVRAPLVARGQARLQAQRVEWHVTEPIDVLTSIGPGGVTQSVENGPAQTIGPEGAGFLASTGLASVLRGDFGGARAHYDIAAAPAAEDGAWTLRLTPRAAQLRRFVAEIEIGGCQAIETVSVRQANGDRTDIRFTPGAP